MKNNELYSNQEYFVPEDNEFDFWLTELCILQGLSSMAYKNINAYSKHTLYTHFYKKGITPKTVYLDVFEKYIKDRK